MQRDIYSWFDEKYRNGERPTLKDRADLLRDYLREEGIHFSQREREKIGRLIKERLFLFSQQRELGPAEQIIAYELATCFGHLVGLSEIEIENNIASYRKLMERKVKEFKENFD